MIHQACIALKISYLFALGLCQVCPFQSEIEQQWCKTAVWFDWLTYDPHTMVQFIEPVMGMVRLALANLPSKATSMLEYLCKVTNCKTILF